jgi:hypothetical protein
MFGYTDAQMMQLTRFAEEVEDRDGMVTRLLFPNGLGLSIAHHDRCYASEGAAELAALKHGEVAYGPQWGDVRGWSTFDEAMDAAEQLANWAEPREFTR